MSRLRRWVLDAGAVVGGLCLVLTVVALLADARPVVFRSGSMEPTVATGALGLTHRVDAADLRVGDVVTVPTADGSVTHRIVELQHDDTGTATLRLRGDANPVADPDVHQVASAERLVLAVPGLGTAVSWLGGPVGLLLLGGWAAFLLSVLLRRAPARALAAAAVVVTLGVTLATSALPARPAAAAGWVKPVPVAGTAMKTRTVPAPATFTCTGLNLLSLSFSWSAVPGASSYTLRWNGGSLTTTALSATTVGLLADGYAWVEANVVYGGTTWTSGPSPSRAYLVLAVALCA